MSDNTIEEAWKWAQENAHKLVVSKALTPEEQRAAFARNTGLALEAHKEILVMELDENDPHFKSKLQAKAQVAGQQITAALKADENKLKAVLEEANYYAELKAALEDYQQWELRELGEGKSSRGGPKRTTPQEEDQGGVEPSLNRGA